LGEWEIGIGLLRALQHLDLQHNSLSTLPEQLEKLVQLESLNVSENALTTVSSEIGTLERLKTFSCTHNVISSLAKEWYQLSSLQVCMSTHSIIAVTYFRTYSIVFVDTVFCELRNCRHRTMN
jgi:Leucine-rich repeat (LRR) protein